MMINNCTSYLDRAHVLNNSHDSHARALAEANFLSYIGKCNFLGSGYENATIDTDITEEVDN